MCGTVTHILYAFANIKPDGEVYLTDLWSDEQIRACGSRSSVTVRSSLTRRISSGADYDGDSWNDTGTNLYGNLKWVLIVRMA